MRIIDSVLTLDLQGKKYDCKIFVFLKNGGDGKPRIAMSHPNPSATFPMDMRAMPRGKNVLALVTETILRARCIAANLDPTYLNMVKQVQETDFADGLEIELR